MITRDQILYETLVILGLDRVHRPKRVMAMALMGIILWVCGLPTVAALFALGICLLELAYAPVLARNIQRKEDLTNGILALIMIHNCVSTAVFLLPTVVLVVQPGFASAMTALLWATGIMVHVTNSRSMLPFYFLIDFIPGIAVTCACLALGFITHAPNAPLWMQFLYGGTVLVYLSNTWQTLAQCSTTRRQLEEARQNAQNRLSKLEHLSRHDALTDLLNRNAFDEDLDKMLAQAAPGQAVTVLLIDLDGFKPINDTYSHQAGDAVLVAVAEHLRNMADTPCARVARLGGDEFAMACASLATEKDAMDRGQALISALSSPVEWHGRQLTIGASVGISRLVPSGDTTTLGSQICAQADQAMYRAKAKKDATPVLYRQADFAPRLSLKDKLNCQEALRNGAIHPYYQPKICLQTGHPIGFEALARWRLPDGTLRMPNDFIPEIREHGLLSEFAYTISRQVLSDLCTLLADGLSPGRVAINVPVTALATLSGRDDLDWLFAEYEEARRLLILEITEDVFTARSGDMVLRSLSYFADSGVRISLDDFGTGYASFQHLRQFRFDELKIDTSFIHGLGEDPVAEILLDGFLAIARGLSIKVVAEGVETERQAEILRSKGCAYAQGYLFGAAVPFAETRATLQSLQRDAS